MDFSIVLKILAVFAGIFILICLIAIFPEVFTSTMKFFRFVIRAFF